MSCRLEGAKPGDYVHFRGAVRRIKDIRQCSGTSSCHLIKINAPGLDGLAEWYCYRFIKATDLEAIAAKLQGNA